MSIISGIRAGGVQRPLQAEIKETKQNKPQEQSKVIIKETPYYTKEASEALRNNVLVNVKKPEIKGQEEKRSADEIRQSILASLELNEKIGVGGVREVGQVEKTELYQNFVSVRDEAKAKAARVGKLARRAIVHDNFNDVKNPQGKVIASFEKGDTDKGQFYSFKMTEFDPETGRVTAETEFMNMNGGLTTVWPSEYRPVAFRKEYNEDGTVDFLKTSFTGRTADKGTDKERLVLKVYADVYAKDYQKVEGTNMKKASKWFASFLNDKYRSYRENYQAHTLTFEGWQEGEGADAIERGGMERELYDGALEYPSTQLIAVSDKGITHIAKPKYISEEGNRPKED